MTVVLVLPYFGNLPNYFQLFLNSVGRNPEFRLLLATDVDVSSYDLSENVEVLPMSFSEMQRRVRVAVSPSACIGAPYKLCDYKPLYGILFSDELQGSDFWGFCDADMLWGRVGEYVTPRVLSEYDKVFACGHFTLLRNDGRINRLALERHDASCGLDMAASTELCCYFDEVGFAKLAKDEGLRVYDEPGFADITPKRYAMTLAPASGCENVSGQRFFYEGGAIVRTTPGGIRDEFMYIHLQKRPMKVCISADKSERFEIRPDGFYPLGTELESHLATLAGELRQSGGFQISRIARLSPQRMCLSARIKRMRGDL